MNFSNAYGERVVTKDKHNEIEKIIGIDFLIEIIEKKQIRIEEK